MNYIARKPRTENGLLRNKHKIISCLNQGAHIETVETKRGNRTVTEYLLKSARSTGWSVKICPVTFCSLSLEHFLIATSSSEQYRAGFTEYDKKIRAA